MNLNGRISYTGDTTQFLTLGEGVIFQVIESGL